MPVWTARCRNQDPGCVSIRGCHKDAQPFFFFYYGSHSLVFGGYPPTAIGYTPTAIGYTPTAIGYPPTAIGYPPTAIGYPPTAIGYTPTAIGYTPTAIGYPQAAISYPQAAIIGRIGHSELFFFLYYGDPWFLWGPFNGVQVGQPSQKH